MKFDGVEGGGGGVEAHLPQELVGTEEVGVEEVKHDPGLCSPQAVLQVLGSEHKRLIPLRTELFLDGLGALQAQHLGIECSRTSVSSFFDPRHLGRNIR